MRLASRGVPQDEAATDSWEEDAAFYIDTFAGIGWIAWVDETFHIQQIVPSQDNETYLGRIASSIERATSDVNQWLPIVHDGEFEGFVFAVLNIGSFISLVLQEINDDYMLQLSDEGVTVFESENWKTPREGSVVYETVTLKDTTVLRMAFAPTDKLLHSGAVDARRTLIFGLLLSFVAIVAVYLARSYSTIAILNELRYRGLFEASQDAIFITNLRGEYRDANPAATRMVGYSLTELRQMTVADLRSQGDMLSPDVLSRMRTEGGMQELSLRGKEGQTIPVELMLSPIGGGKAQKYVLVIARDITERVRAAAALQEYSERLEELVDERTKDLKNAQEELVRKGKLAVLGQLSGGVGHELRNPLGVISNAVYFLQMTLSDADETTSEYLGIISSEVRTAEKIVSDLLDFSRVKSLEREETALSDLIDQALEKQPPPKSVKVTTEIPSELPPVFVDSRQIVQVLLNLVVNGYQAMPEGGELKITTRTEKSRVNLYITDTGCGISKENLKKIFEPLFTTRARGIGLGLAVSKNLMEANGGSLGVESEEGKGTTFTVTLPTKEEGN